MINPLPSAPAATDAVDVFDAKAFAFLAALQLFATQTNGVAGEVQTNADITAAIALGMALPNYGGTSTSNLTIGTGARSIATQGGKSWTVGQVVVVSNGAGAYMKGTVTGYSGAVLDVDVTVVVGAGTYSSWTIGLGFTSLGLQPRATRIDVPSVAGTVNLSANAPDTDDIRLTGALVITGFTLAVGRVVRVTAGGAFTLTNNANIVTQTGGNIVAAVGDTFMLRATAANTVEVLSYSYAGVVPDASISPAKLSRPPTFGTAVATTSGTAHDVTGIPSWVNEVIIPFGGVSTNGTSPVRLQLGCGGVVQTTGYESTATVMGVANGTSTSGFDRYQTAAADVAKGWFMLIRITGNTWLCVAQYALNAATNPGWITGTVTLSSSLDRIRFTTVGNTDAFDGGFFNVLFR